MGQSSPALTRSRPRSRPVDAAAAREWARDIAARVEALEREARQHRSLLTQLARAIYRFACHRREALETGSTTVDYDATFDLRSTLDAIVDELERAA